MGNVGFFELSLQLGKLGFSLLVQFNLSCSVVSCIFQSLTKIFDVSGQERSILFGLCTVLSFNSKFFINLFKAALKLLDLAAVFASKSLLIFDLGSHGGKFLFLSLDGSRQFTLDAFQVRYSFLGQLKVTLNFALDLFNIRFCLLFTFPMYTAFIPLLFKLSLNLVQVVAFILTGLNIFFGLLARISNVSLFLSAH